MRREPIIVLLGLMALLLGVPVASAQFGTETFTEDFEDCFQSFSNPDGEPQQDWYTHTDNAEIGECSSEDAVEGIRSFRVQSPSGVSVGDKTTSFDLEAAAALSSTTFFIRGEPIANTTGGSNQVVTIESAAPRRSVVEFYVLCDLANATQGCEFRVRFEQADSFGQILIPASNNQTTFKVRLDFDWFEGTYQLFVDDVDDGVFPFFEGPKNVDRLSISQARASSGLNATLDNWTVEGAFAEPEGAIGSDAAEGIKNFLTAIHFTSEASLLLFGVVLLVIMLAAVIMPLLALGRDNTVVPAVGFYGVLCVLWLIKMEIFPDWIGIVLIIATAAVISLGLMRGLLGIRDAGRGAGFVVGTFGFFIIATTFLGFSGYGGETITLPVADQEITAVEDGATGEENETRLNFVGGVVDCIVGGGVFAGIAGNFGTALAKCSRGTDSFSDSWLSKTVDSIGRVTATIFSYGRAALDFMFQLLAFQLPIPIILNMIIVLPPAVGLASFAIMIIRGVSP